MIHIATQSAVAAAVAAAVLASLEIRADTIPSRARATETRSLRRADEYDVAEGELIDGASVQCPPGDRLDWVREQGLPPATEIIWVTLRNPREFTMMCGELRGRHLAGAYVGACATVTSDGLGVIYSRESRSRIPEWIRQHEECHTQRWSHDVPAAAATAR